MARVVDYLVLWNTVSRLTEDAKPEDAEQMENLGLNDPAGFLKKTTGFDIASLGLSDSELEELRSTFDEATDKLLDSGFLEAIKNNEPIDEMLKNAGDLAVSAMDDIG